MRMSIWIKPGYWKRLQDVKKERRIPISAQIELALEKYWRDENGQ